MARNTGPRSLYPAQPMYNQRPRNAGIGMQAMQPAGPMPTTDPMMQSRGMQMPAVRGPAAQPQHVSEDPRMAKMFMDWQAQNGMPAFGGVDPGQMRQAQGDSMPDYYVDSDEESLGSLSQPHQISRLGEGFGAAMDFFNSKYSPKTMQILGQRSRPGKLTQLIHALAPAGAALMGNSGNALMKSVDQDRRYWQDKQNLIAQYYGDPLRDAERLAKLSEMLDPDSLSNQLRLGDAYVKNMKADAYNRQVDNQIYSTDVRREGNLLNYDQRMAGHRIREDHYLRADALRAQAIDDLRNYRQGKLSLDERGLAVREKLIGAQTQNIASMIADREKKQGIGDRRLDIAEDNLDLRRRIFEEGQYGNGTPKMIPQGVPPQDAESEDPNLLDQFMSMMPWAQKPQPAKIMPTQQQMTALVSQSGGDWQKAVQAAEAQGLDGTAWLKNYSTEYYSQKASPKPSAPAKKSPPPVKAQALTDRSLALQFLQQAQGDKNKARELARKAGYNF